MKNKGCDEHLCSIRRSDFAPCLMFVIVFSVSFLLMIFPEQVRYELAVSPHNILGVFTSIFVHTDLIHLSINILIATIGMPFLFLSIAFSGERPYSFLILSVWLSAVTSNVIYLFFMYSRPSVGSSGLVSAFLGGIVAFAYAKGSETSILRDRIIQTTIGTVFIAAFIVLNVFINSDTNIAVHLAAFLIMIVLVALKISIEHLLKKTS